MKIAIVNLINVIFDETSINDGLGGSETWAIQLSEAFKRKNHDVYVFSNTKTTHISTTNVKWINNSLIYPYFLTEKFDFIIISRIPNDLLDFIAKTEPTQNVFIQCHDPNVCQNTSQNGLNYPFIKKIIALTHWHKMYLNTSDRISLNNIEIIPNGIDPLLFPITKNETDHKLLWSSCIERNFNILMDDIYPLIKGEIKDFEIDVAAYNDIQGIEGIQGVNFLGKLNKQQLYTEMNKHSTYFYPCVSNETFCITSIENAMCQNNMILPLQYGPADIFYPFKDEIGMKNYFDRSKEEYNAACNEAAEKIINSIVNPNYNQELKNEIRNYILSNFTWDKVAEKYIQLYEECK